MRVIPREFPHLADCNRRPRDTIGKVLPFFVAAHNRISYVLYPRYIACIAPYVSRSRGTRFIIRYVLSRIDLRLAEIGDGGGEGDVSRRTMMHHILYINELAYTWGTLLRWGAVEGGLHSRQSPARSWSRSLTLKWINRRGVDWRPATAWPPRLEALMRCHRHRRWRRRRPHARRQQRRSKANFVSHVSERAHAHAPSVTFEPRMSAVKCGAVSASRLDGGHVTARTNRTRHGVRARAPLAGAATVTRGKRGISNCAMFRFDSRCLETSVREMKARLPEYFWNCIIHNLHYAKSLRNFTRLLRPAGTIGCQLQTVDISHAPELYKLSRVNLFSLFKKRSKLLRTFRPRSLPPLAVPLIRPQSSGRLRDGATASR